MNRLLLTTMLMLMQWSFGVAVEPSVPGSDSSSGATTRSAADQDEVIVRAVMRMSSVDLAKYPDANAAIQRHIARRVGKPDYLDLVRRFNPANVEQSLAEMVAAIGDDNRSMQAMRLLLSRPAGSALVKQFLQADSMETVGRFSDMVGTLGNPIGVKLLSATLHEIDSEAPAAYQRRSAIVRGLAKSNLGGIALLDSVQDGTLPGDVKLLAGGLLSRNADEAVRQRAAELLPQPTDPGRVPLPPLDELVRLSGNVENGLALFRGVATCANCHIVRGTGKQVGPDLSEIGDKLSREAFYLSILDPNAGISHNYENWIALTDSGRIVNGILVTQTEEKIVLRSAEAFDIELDANEVIELKKSEKSIMPENLHQTIDQQGLVDVVEYLMTLKKL